MFQYKSENEQEREHERRDLIWQMLTAQLASSHERLMTQYGMEIAQPAPRDEQSLLRGPGRKIDHSPSASPQLPSPRRGSHVTPDKS